MFRGLRIAVAIATCTSSMPSAHAGSPPPSEAAPPDDAAASEAPEGDAPPDEAPDGSDAPAVSDGPEAAPIEAEPSAPPVDVAEPTPPPPTVPDRGVSQPAEAEAEAEAEADTDTDESDATYDVLRDAPEAVVARQRIIGGSVMLGVGVLLGAGAIAMGVSDPCSRAAGNSCNRGARTRAALALGIPGFAITAGGATLLGVGLKARAQLRAGVVVHRGEGGVVVQGRF